MTGYYVTYHVDVNYSGLIDVFVPDGEDADEMFNEELDEILEDFPKEINGLFCDNVDYEEK